MLVRGKGEEEVAEAEDQGAALKPDGLDIRMLANGEKVQLPFGCVALLDICTSFRGVPRT